MITCVILRMVGLALVSEEAMELADFVIAMETASKLPENPSLT